MGANEADGTKDVGASRREVLKKAAAAGAIVWTAPQVMATAAFGAPGGGDHHHGSTTTTTTIAPPGGKTICGSVRFTTYKVIKWHFIGSSGAGQRTDKNDFKSTKAHPAVCLAGETVACGNSTKTIENWVSSAETGGGTDASDQNHGFTETAFSGGGFTPYTWTITPPSGWTLVAAGGELWGQWFFGFFDGSDCTVRVSEYADFPDSDGSSESHGFTTYAISGNTFTATGFPHWVELVVAQ